MSRKRKDKRKEKLNKRGKYNAKSIRILSLIKIKTSISPKKKKINNIPNQYKI
jgi:hypothetical protein